MDLLEKKNLYNTLFDFYGKLLTEKQQMYFQHYYFEDLSLSEISEIYQVSRNAVFDQLHKTYHLLEEYEEKLGLYHKYQEYQKLCQVYENTTNDELREFLEKLKSLE